MSISLSAKPLTIAESVAKSALAAAVHLHIRESRRACSAGEVARVLTELVLEERLPLAKAPRQQCKKKNPQNFYPRFYLCSSSSALHASQFELVTYSSFCPLRFPIRNELPRHQKNQLIRHQNTFSNNANHPCDENPQQDLVNKWKGSDSVDAAGKVAQAVAVANEAAGLEGAGTLAAQVRKHL